MIEFCQKMEVNKSVNMGEVCVKISKNKIEGIPIIKHAMVKRL